MATTPNTPHAQMKALDDEGTAYQITELQKVGEGRDYATHNVLAHSPEWIWLQDEEGRDFWLQMRHVLTIRIEEMG